MAIFLEERYCLIFRYFYNFDILAILRVSNNFEHISYKLNLNHHSLAIYDFLFHELHSIVLIRFVESLASYRPHTTCRSYVGQVEVSVCHSLDGVFVLCPVLVHFFSVEGSSLIMQSLQKTAILQLNALELSLSEDIIETLVGFDIDMLGFGNRVGSSFAHDGGYFLQEQSILALNFYLPHLLDHLSFAVIDDDSGLVLHEFRVHGFHLFEVAAVVGVLYFLLLSFYEAVHVWS